MIVRAVKQRERTEKSTNAMLEAAADLIVEGGFALLTFAAIGERSGYSRSLVTERFGSKDGLLEALVDRTVTTWSHRNLLPQTRGKSGLIGIERLLDAIRRQAEIEPRGLRVLYSLIFEALGPDEHLRRRFADFHATMRKDVARLITKGQFDRSIRSDVDAAAESGLVVAGLRGIGYQWLLDSDGFDIVTALGHLQRTTVARLEAP